MAQQRFSLRLEAFSAAEFADYMLRQQERFAMAKAEIESLPRETVLAAVRQQLAETLPQGQGMPGHSFVKLVAESLRGGSQVVGEAWFARHESPLGQEGFLYDIFIHSDHRRQGHGRAALAAIEQELKGHGCRQLWLNVFATNASARAFYEACGYRVGTLHLTKSI